MSKRVFTLVLLFLFIPTVCFGAASADFERGDGSDNYSLSSASSALDMTDDVTDHTGCVYLNVESFSTPTAFSNNIFLLDKSGDGWGAAVGDDTGVGGDETILYTSGGNSGAVSAGASTGVWEWYCFQFEQSNNNIFIYFEGTQQYSDASYTDNSAAANPNIFVGENASNANEYDGKMAHLQMLDFIPGNVIMQEMRYKPMSIELMAGWPLWIGSTAVDLSGNGNDLTGSGITESADGPPVMFGGGLPL